MLLAEHPAIDRQGLPRQRLGGDEIALRHQQAGEVAHRRPGVGVVGAEDLHRGGEGFAEQDLGAGEIAAPLQDLSQVALAGRRFAVILPERRLADGERLAGRRLGLVVPSLIGQRARQFDERDRDVGVPRPEHRAAHRHRFAQQGFGLHRLTHLAEQHAEVVEARRQAGVRGPQAASGRDRLLEQRQRLVETSHALEGAADDREHLGLQLRPIAELAGDPGGAAIEQALDGGLGRIGVAVRIGAGQQVGEQRADLRRLVRLEARAIALGLQALRVEHDDGDEHRQRRHAGGEGAPVALRELGGAIAERVRPGRDRLVLEHAPQIFRELRDRGVALGRIALQRLGDDRLEIAAQQAVQAIGRRGPVLGPLGGDPGVLAQRRGGEPHRLADGDGLDELDRRAGAEAGRVVAGEQLEEQHAERVDVGRGGDLAAGDLLGRGVLRRQGDAALARQHRHRFVVAEQLGDAEIEQLHLAVAVHEDVRRLQVAVDDQVGVGVRDRRLDVQEEADACLDAEPLVVAVAIDVLAVDVLEHEVGLTGPRDAGVDQPRDVGVRQLGEDRAFAAEPGLPFPPEQRRVQQLDRGAALEAAVAALGEPDAAHPALVDRRDERVAAEGDPGQRHVDRRHAAVEEALVVQLTVLEEQRLDVGGGVGVRGPQLAQPGIQLVVRQVEGLVQEPAGAIPAAGVDHVHASVHRRLDRKRPRKPVTPAWDRPSGPGAGRSGPSPSPAGRCARTGRACCRSRRTKSRRST